MSDLCTPTFLGLADRLGGVPCEDAHRVAYVNNPFDLADATMPFVELLMVGGAVLALVHAVRTLRRTGSAVNLGVWIAAVVYVAVLEPPLYFPAAFGIDDYVSAVFVHNEFTVGFVYERMPLYILCLYPALVYLAWVLVERLGIRARHPGWRGALLTAVCLGFTHQAFYEIFDHLGPQRLWWAWDYSASMNQDLLGSVPMSSVVNFALVMPTAFAFLCLMVLTRKERPSVRSVLPGAVAVGVLTPLVSMPGQLPVTYLDLVDDPNTDAVHAVLIAMLVGAGVLTLREVLARWRAPEPQEPGFLGWYPVVHLGAYLGTFAVLWAWALPQTLGATDGVTDDGRFVGSLPYVVLCFVLTAVIAAPLVRDARRRTPVPDPVLERQP
ncbi:hypothetical protein ABIE44_003171 [Marmoricola sp. OAE513]|uniref:DUF7802 domain-containing protein n=1 Tax=Marmoricola sp. OAE513 TaxID=2817894 RepID=UPI001AE898FE